MEDETEDHQVTFRQLRTVLTKFKQDLKQELMSEIRELFFNNNNNMANRNYGENG